MNEVTEAVSECVIGWLVRVIYVYGNYGDRLAKTCKWPISPVIDGHVWYFTDLLLPPTCEIEEAANYTTIMAAQASEELDKLKCEFYSLCLDFDRSGVKVIVLIVIASDRPKWTCSRASKRCR